MRQTGLVEPNRALRESETFESCEHLRARLAFARLKRDIVCRKAGGGRAPRQPGQVRKEAAVTSFGSGRRPVFRRLPRQFISRSPQTLGRAARAKDPIL